MRLSATLVPRRITTMRLAHREHVGHAVADQHDGDAAVLEAADEVEHLGDLPDADRRRRLVHQDDTGVGEPGAGDRDCLALPAGHLLDEVARPRLRLELLEQFGDADIHRRIVEDAERADFPLQLAAEKDVGGGRQVVAKGEVLVDDLDPLGAGVDRLVKVLHLALDPDLAFGGTEVPGDHPHERRLSGAVVAHEADDLAGLDRKIDALQRLDRAEMLGDAL